MAVVGVMIGVLVNRNSESNTSSPTTNYTTPGASPYPTEASSATQPVQVPTVSSAPQDPEQQLRQIANADRSYVAAQLTDRWVPQLSSKRPGVVDNGVVWDNAMTLQEHQQLRRKYPNVRLLWSGDWSTFSGRTSGSQSRALPFPTPRVRWPGAAVKDLIGTTASPRSSAPRILWGEARRTTDFAVEVQYETSSSWIYGW